MGISKSQVQKNVIARSYQLLSGETISCLNRYDNVMVSRCSVIPLFVQQTFEGNESQSLISKWLDL